MNKKKLFSRLALLVCLALLALTVLSCVASGEDASLRETGNMSDQQENTPKKRIAFTFDDGPHPEYTKAIVTSAKALGGKVTFFIVGDMLFNEGASDALVYAAESGCEIGIHSFTHTVNYDECDTETYLYELSRTVEVASRYLPSFAPTLMRPVGGRISNEHVKISPYAVVKWNIDTRDWEHKSAANAAEQEKNVSAIVDEILDHAADGAIILMHDLYENSAIAFFRAAEILVSEGYELVTVSELLGDDVEAGKVFSKGKPITAVMNPSSD